VLSHGALQHLHHLPKTNRPPFDQAHHHADVLQKPAPPGRRRAGRRGQRWTLAPPRIQGLLLYLAFRFPIVSDAALPRLLPPMCPAAPEWTAQVPPASVARVAEKKNPTVPASGQALSQPGLNPQDRSQHQVIRQHQGRDRLVAIPLRVEPKMRCDLSCKKPRLSL
jgi:hypothetical protein